MLRILIVDDEAHMRDTLAKMLVRYCPQAEVAGEADGVATGVKAIQKLNPTLVLLDVQMADGTGFDLLKALPAIDFQVIFITAYDQYALQAFKFSAVDYLLKPVNPEHLITAISRAEVILQDHFRLQMQALEENLNAVNHQNKKIILKTTEKIYLLELKNIISCESDNCYTVVNTTEDNRIMISKTLKEFDDMLTGCGFYRIHKSHLINLSHIKRFEKQDGGYIILTNDLKIPVASRKREELMELFEKLAQ